MENREKRARASNWNHAHTMELAKLKREASLNKEGGRLVWERIAQTLSSRFPGQIRTGDQCRMRWDTLVKVYNHIEDYCVVTGAQDHRELDEGELASMKLDTTYQQDWYDIVEEVCSQRKRKERGDRDLMLAKRSKSSLSVELPERPPEHPDTLCPALTSKSVTHCEQSTRESTTTFAQVSSSPSLEADKLSPEEEDPRLRNGNDGLMLEQSTSAYTQVSSSPSLEVDKLSPEEEVLRLQNGNDGLVLEAPQLRQQYGQVSHGGFQEPQTLESANLQPHTFTAENGVQLKEPLQDDIWASLDCISFETSAEMEQYGTESELPDPSLWAIPHLDPLNEDEFYSPIAYFVPTSLGRASEFRFLSAISTSSTSSRSADSTISRQSQRWSLKVILLNVLQCCHACGRQERTEDMDMESKQADRFKEKPRKKTLMPRKENVSPMLDAASSTSAASATRGDKPLQKDTQRISKSAALDKKEEETRTREGKRPQLGGKSSSKCMPVGKLCAKLSRKLFPVFHGQSSRH